MRHCEDQSSDKKKQQNQLNGINRSLFTMLFGILTSTGLYFMHNCVNNFDSNHWTLWGAALALSV